MLNDTSSYDEIYEIKDLFKSIKRNKISFFKFLGVSIFFSLFIAFTKTKTWEGDFQIVLQDNSELKNSLLLNSPISEKLGTDVENIKTKVGILKSSSILMPVFEYYKNQKIQKNKNVDNLLFKKWIKKHLKINLTDKTKILNIKFTDSDKDIIIPILNNISNQYQTYSKKSRLRELELQSNYLKKQISLYRIQSNESLKKVQEFASDLDLIIPREKINIKSDIENSNSGIPNVSSFIIPNVEIENIRITAANEIKEIDLQLSKIRNLEDSELLQYIFYTIPSRGTGVPIDTNELKLIEEKLVFKRKLYRENDEEIQNLKKRKSLLIEILKDRTIGFLQAKKLFLKSKLEASIRPKDSLLNYKELLRKASRDELTLINLENKYRSLKLEEAKQKDPWELITKPTLNPYPSSPNKKRILFLGLILGFISGGAYSLFKDYRSNLIFNLKTLKKITRCKTVINLKENEKSNWKIQINALISRNILKTETIGIQTFGSKVNTKIKELEKVLTQTELKVDYYISDKINDLEKCDLFIIAATLGDTKINEIEKTSDIIQMQNKNIICLILI